MERIEPLKIDKFDILLQNTIYLSTINKLLNNELITIKQYYKIKEKIKNIG